jgi:hypothetical protein
MLENGTLNNKFITASNRQQLDITKQHGKMVHRNTANGTPVQRTDFTFVQNGIHNNQRQFGIITP